MTRPRAERARDSRRRTYLLRSGVAGIFLTALAVVIYLIAPDSNGPTPPKAISAADANRRACVLSGPHDTNLPVIDNGLQQAARDNGHLDVQHYTVPPSTRDATPMINSLVSLRCTVIIGLGTQVNNAILTYTDGGQTIAARFIILGDTPRNTASVSSIAPGALTPNTVATLVETAAK